MSPAKRKREQGWSKADQVKLERDIGRLVLTVVGWFTPKPEPAPPRGGLNMDPLIKEYEKSAKVEKDLTDLLKDLTKRIQKLED